MDDSYKSLKSLYLGLELIDENLYEDLYGRYWKWDSEIMDFVRIKE